MGGGLPAVLEASGRPSEALRGRAGFPAASLAAGASRLAQNHGSWQRPGFNFIERHSGVGIAGFCDGHAKAMKHTVLYSNGSNSPHSAP